MSRPAPTAVRRTLRDRATSQKHHISSVSTAERDDLGLAHRLGAALVVGGVGEKLGMDLPRLMARWMRKENQGSVREPRSRPARG